MNLKKYIIDKTDSLEIAISKILIGSARTIFVVDKNKVIGSISEGDVLRSLLQKKNLNSPARNIMNKSFKFLYDKKKINEAKKIFKKHNMSILPILNKNNELVDVILMRNVI